MLSEYGLRDVSSPIHLNRVLRERGLLAVREELGHEVIDPGASAAFAVADHQVAHVYVNDPSKAHEVRAHRREDAAASRPCSTRRANARTTSIIRGPAI